MGQVGHTGIEGSVIPANVNFLYRGAKITKYIEGLERVFLHVRVHFKKTKIHRKRNLPVFDWRIVCG